MTATEVKQPLGTDPEFQSWLKGVLHDDVVKDLRITFTKKDGTEREMFCTLSESKIPEEKRPKEAQSSSTIGSALRVFDTQIGEWRSFRWDSIKQVNFEI
jgi:hypothetical protein